jgi:hypothetical protein
MTMIVVKKSRAIWWICLLAIAILFINVARSAPQIAEILVGGDGDDLTRLLQVRDWLAGQSWFDTTQYRMLPPEGVSIHWSRYVDLGIAAFLVPASWFLSQTQAEHVAVILWPTFLGCLALFVIGFSNNRLLGPAAAIGALVTFLTWGKLGGEFSAGRIDHHNVQILCGTAAFYLSLLPGRRWHLGAMAGAVTALGLAVGLEMLPFFAVLWAVMVLRHAFGENGVDQWLLGFAFHLPLRLRCFWLGRRRCRVGGSTIAMFWRRLCLLLRLWASVATLAASVFAQDNPTSCQSYTGIS